MFLSFRTYIKVSVFLILSSTLAGYVNANTSERDSLQNRIEKIQQNSGFNPKDTLYINLLNALGNTMRFYNADSLFLLSQEALTHSKATNYTKGKCIALLGLGEYYSDKGAHTKSIHHFKSALAIAEEQKNMNLFLDIKNSLGLQFDVMGNHAKAISTYLEGIELAKAENNNQMLGIFHENIATLYASQKDYTNALKFYKTALDIGEELKDEDFQAPTMSNIASTYAELGQLEYAMYNINRSIAILEKNNTVDWLAYAYQVKGKVYLKQEKYKWALFWYNQSKILYDQLEDKRAEIDLFNGMAEAYLGKGQKETSHEYALKAFTISKEIDFKEGMRRCAKILYKINKSQEQYAKALNYHEIYQKLSDTLSNAENKKSLMMFAATMDHEGQKLALVRENEMALARQQRYVNVALAFLLVVILAMLLIHRSEKIQKKLNAQLHGKALELEQSKKELQEINDSKDKLFSIVAHDLRGPIGAFQGLLKLYKDNEINQNEFLGFIPKLRTDIDHLGFTLNNLLSWGQSQMNGVSTKPKVISLDCIANENINFLSEMANSKSIKLESRLLPNMLAWSDADQMDIVMRNLISNALKFTPENGTITITAAEDKDYWEIAVRDNGIGMDKETQKKIFEENTTISTYGTNNEKGTGIGLQLCKEMVQKNNGTIWVESFFNKGTTFYFTVPKAKKKYQKAV